MNYTVKGTIISITDVETLQNGAAKLSYRIDTKEQYNNIWEFEIYKGVEHVEHANKFSEYNKVGDNVEVEFNIRPRIWAEKDRVFTTLSSWKCTKVDGSISEQYVNQQVETTTSTNEDDLPF